MKKMPSLVSNASSDLDPTPVTPCPISNSGAILASTAVLQPTNFKGNCFPADFTLHSILKSSSILSSTLSHDRVIPMVKDLKHETCSTSSVITKSTSNSSINLPVLISDEDDIPQQKALHLEATQKWLPIPELTQLEREELSRKANRQVVNLDTARETRDNQRWAQAIDPRIRNSRTTVRLVAGCVPILNDGRVLLISSRKQNEWLSLPKGGWELDECLEEGAIRETYEEAGVVGILGPSFDSFLVESKKNGNGTPNGMADDSGVNMSDGEADSNDRNMKDSDHSASVAYCSLITLTPIPGKSLSLNSDTSSIPSHTHTCMTFFPLYVQEIKDVWPENIRERKAYPIDEAINLVRPELRWLLERIQREGLHNICR